MRKLSEVMRLTGLSRKALQGYSDIGLQGPTAQTASKYRINKQSSPQPVHLSRAAAFFVPEA